MFPSHSQIHKALPSSSLSSSSLLSPPLVPLHLSTLPISSQDFNNPYNPYHVVTYLSWEGFISSLWLKPIVSWSQQGSLHRITKGTMVRTGTCSGEAEDRGWHLIVLSLYSHLCSHTTHSSRSCLVDEETEAKKGYVTCLGLQSSQEAEAWLEPGLLSPNHHAFLTILHMADSMKIFSNMGL